MDSFVEQGVRVSSYGVGGWMGSLYDQYWQNKWSQQLITLQVLACECLRKSEKILQTPSTLISSSKLKWNHFFQCVFNSFSGRNYSCTIGFYLRFGHKTLSLLVSSWSSKYIGNMAAPQNYQFHFIRSNRALRAKGYLGVLPSGNS